MPGFSSYFDRGFSVTVVNGGRQIDWDNAYDFLDLKFADGRIDLLTAVIL